MAERYVVYLDTDEYGMDSEGLLIFGVFDSESQMVATVKSEMNYMRDENLFIDADSGEYVPWTVVSYDGTDRVKGKDHLASYL